ncbi:n-rich protein, putative [Ricinus communis]|uniref:N-rich protein, putative n=1 Tax=Ricinus communis TaxID=3988 RepID=B9RYM8_RICCO|nr:n-rich protein, putative [Ricinus communis]|eukprot:XP_002518847.1 B2 protein [Ricinus communis]
MENNQQSFRQFSDQLRVQTSNLANLSLNDSIWSNSYGSKRPDERRNFDIRVGGEVNNSAPTATKLKGSDLNGLNDDWKTGAGTTVASPDLNGFNNWKMGSNVTSSNLNGFNDNWKMVSNVTSSNLNGFNDNWKMGSNVTSSDVNGFNDNWKMGSKSYGLGPIGPISGGGGGSQKHVGINGGFSKGIYSKNNYSINNNINVNLKGYKNKGEDEFGVKTSKKNNNKKNSGGDNNNNDGKDNSKSGTDKRFKTLPPSESLPRNETVGGYIFVCNNDTMQENLKRQLFGLPPRYRDSVRAITPGLPLFLYNYSTHQLHGIFEAASFGGTNIDPTAWEDKKCPGESRFPAQVRVVTRKICEPLEEDSFRPILHHYDGPKFRLELNIPEVLSLLDIFDEQNP